MKENKKYLEQRADIITKKLGKQASFTVADVVAVLPEDKKSSIYWTLSKLAEQGYIQRIGKGLYSLEKKGSDVQPVLSNLAQKILKVLNESGYQFFLSGLDILSVFMEHIPESYPVLLFAEKYSVEEVRDVLKSNSIDTVTLKKIKDYQEIRQLSSVNEIVLLNPTKEFTYSDNGLASFEKAFVDIYYAVTRNKYPLSTQELSRIFTNMKRRISLNSSRLNKIASRRSIQKDIRYILENDKILK